MRYWLAGLTALSLACAASAVATECEEYIVVGTDATGYLFVDNEVCQPDCLFSIWVYADDDPDPCDGEANTIVI